MWLSTFASIACKQDVVAQTGLGKYHTSVISKNSVIMTNKAMVSK